MRAMLRRSHRPPPFEGACPGVASERVAARHQTTSGDWAGMTRCSRVRAGRGRSPAPDLQRPPRPAAAGGGGPHLASRHAPFLRQPGHCGPDHLLIGPNSGAQVLPGWCFEMRGDRGHGESLAKEKSLLDERARRNLHMHAHKQGADLAATKTMQKVQVGIVVCNCRC